MSNSEQIIVYCEDCGNYFQVKTPKGNCWDIVAPGEKLGVKTCPICLANKNRLRSFKKAVQK